MKSDVKEKEPIPSIPVFEEESELEITESIDFQQQNWLRYCGGVIRRSDTFDSLKHQYMSNYFM